MERPFEPHPYPKNKVTADAVVGALIAGMGLLVFTIGWSLAR